MSTAVFMKTVFPNPCNRNFCTCPFPWYVYPMVLYVVTIFYMFPWYSLPWIELNLFTCSFLCIRSAYNGSQEWVVISDDSICCYSRMDISRESTKKSVKAILPLCNTSIITVLHSTLKKDTSAPVSTTKISQAFAIEQFREDGNIMTYFVADNANSKKEWIRVLESVLQEKCIKKNVKNLKEVSVVPIDVINTPMLLRSKSASSNKSHLSSLFDQETKDWFLQ